MHTFDTSPAAIESHSGRLNTVHGIHLIHREQHAIQTKCGLSGRVTRYAGSLALGIVPEAHIAFGNPDYIVRCVAEDADVRITCMECLGLVRPNPRSFRSVREYGEAIARSHGFSKSKLYPPRGGGFVPEPDLSDVFTRPVDGKMTDSERERYTTVTYIIDAAMASATEQNVMITRMAMTQIVAGIFEAQKAHGVQLPTVTRPSITTDQYLAIVSAVMVKEKELAGDKAKRRFSRQDAMRFVTTMLDTQASLQAGGPTTGVPFGPSEFDAQLLAVKQWIGAAVTFMNFAAGQGLIYCPDDRDKPDNDHPAQPDTAMMKLWQAFGEPQEETSDEKVNAHLTGAITDLLGL